MEKEELSSRRPSIAFPLGLALLLLLLFCISCLLICYFNWNKLRTLIFGSSDQNWDDDNNDIESDIADRSSDFQDSSPVIMAKGKIVGQSPLVLMPGDKVPRFIAMACPCEPPRTEKITITVPKPPALSVPFY
ncbi:hypothetical protein like AT5G65660 [Hibiscus trionum]|uniref:Hydroxyproline-rich glycoprotein family protein n=1 Tax=Hibiscus trionum TaxID=183268 RepID=A0A9W7HI84_HIBTR|nr:hypothetical protein like AT5G65660 [Hibiscus trionum]